MLKIGDRVAVKKFIHNGIDHSDRTGTVTKVMRFRKVSVFLDRSDGLPQREFDLKESNLRKI